MFKRSGLYPEFWESMKHATLQSMPKELQDAYRTVAPHPEQLTTFHDKCVKRVMEFNDWRAEDIQAIQAPTLLMFGDGDIVRPEHAVEMFRLLPHAQLAILPGTDHMTLVRRADWQISMIEAFLEAPQPNQSNAEEKIRESRAQLTAELRRTVEQFIEAADHADADSVGSMYAPDFVNVRITDAGEIVRLDRGQLLSFFSRAGGKHIPTKTTTIHQVEIVGDTGYVLLTRVKDLGNGWEPMFYSLVWKRRGEGWHLWREFVHQRALPNGSKQMRDPPREGRSR
jgi:hypothetical protein